MNGNKVLYISQQIAPYVSNSKQGKINNSLLNELQMGGCDVRTFMPKFGCINERRNQLHEVIRLSGLNISIDDTDHPLIIKVATLQPARMQVYFIYNEEFYSRTIIKEYETDVTPELNDERCMFYTRGVLETVKKLRWVPEIIHCNGWISALSPLYLKTLYADDPTYSQVKVVTSLFNETLPKDMDVRMAEKLALEGIAPEYLSKIEGKAADMKTLMKLAIDNSDAIVEAEEGVDAELLEYAKAQGKPVMPYPGEENYVEKYAEFYKSL